MPQLAQAFTVFGVWQMGEGVEWQIGQRAEWQIGDGVRIKASLGKEAGLNWWHTYQKVRPPLP